MQTWFIGADGGELCGVCYVYIQRVPTAAPVKLLHDTDISGEFNPISAAAT